MTAPDAPQGAPVPNTRAEALTAEELVLQYQERFAQLRDALGDMIHEFGAGAGWRTEKQEAALEKALQVFLGRPVVERDDTAELVEAVDTFLSRLEDFLGATTAALEAWANGNRPNIPAYGAAAARLATSGGKLRAALARVKGGER